MLGRKINCTDCLNVIDGDEDEFCMVVPHGKRYSHKPMIPLCQDCRAEQGYDIRASYNVVSEKSRFEQPSLPRLTHQSPETKTVSIPVMNNETALEA